MFVTVGHGHGKWGRDVGGRVQESRTTGLVIVTSRHPNTLSSRIMAVLQGNNVIRNFVEKRAFLYSTPY